MSSPRPTVRRAGPTARHALPAVLALLALAAGCARPRASAGPTSQPIPEPVRTVPEVVSSNDGSRYIYQPLPDQIATDAVRVPLARAWMRLPDVYELLGLPAAGIDPGRRQLGTGEFRTQGRLGKASLSEYLDCGRGVLGQQVADTYGVTMRVVSELAAASDSATEVRTLVLAAARPTTSNGDRVRCVSTGRLEKRITAALREVASR